jgi:ABC-type sugar transport system ATPase subunit
LLELRGITKAFDGVVVVDDVGLTLERGEIHGLVGENGAGKTTLIKVLAGEHHAEAGEILIEGEPLTLRHPSEAIRHGIAIIHQDPALVPNVSVAENLALGLGFTRDRLGAINWRAQRRLSASALARVGLDVNPRERLLNLSIADRQLVAIARLLVHENRRIAVFDEASAPLTEAEVKRLFAIIGELRSAGVGIIYVTHRLDEIFRLSDRVTVMRDGVRVATRPTSKLSQPELVELIIGHQPPERLVETRRQEQREVIMSLRNVSDELLHGVSLDLHAGEVVGLAGLVGSGRTNVLAILFGITRPSSGAVLMDGKPVAFRHPSDAIRRGIAMVTEDRKRSGYVADFPIWKNITLPSVRRFSRAGVLSLRAERAFAAAAAKRFDVRAHSIGTPIRSLSGGNQQKTILARWLSQRVRVLLLDEPTNGVDVGAKEEIYRVIHDVAAEGVATLIVSSELEELELLCSRVLLLREGELLGELTGRDVTKARMLTELYQHDNRLDHANA